VYRPAFHEVLASAAVGGYQGDPVIEAVASARAGRDELAGVEPLVLVNVLQILSILGEFDVLERAYAGLSNVRSGAVHFEAGLSALMQNQSAVAHTRFRRALDSEEPQAMAWNSLALLYAAQGEIQQAVEAIEQGLQAMPGDRVTRGTAATLFLVAGKPERAVEIGLTPADALAFRRKDPADRLAETKERLNVLLVAFPHYAQMAADAVAVLERMPQVPGLGVAAAMEHLRQRAAALTPTVSKRKWWQFWR
jgi:tetratricopeptide (TPR) repeat protein